MGGFSMNWLSKEWFQLYGGTERDGPARKALEAGGGWGQEAGGEDSES